MNGRLPLLALAALAAVIVLSARSHGVSDDGRARNRPRPARTVGPPTKPVPEDREPPRPTPPGRRTAPPPRAGNPAPEGDPAPPFDPRAAGRRPEALAAAYAEQFANWTARTLPRQFNRLAVLSTGRLAAANRRAAADQRAVAALRRDGAGMRGHIVRAVPDDRGAAAPMVRVVLAEHYFGRHAGAASQRAAYRAVLRRVNGGWRIGAWQPLAP